MKEYDLSVTGTPEATMAFRAWFCSSDLPKLLTTPVHVLGISRLLDPKLGILPRGSLLNDQWLVAVSSR
jgi:hypothetical protein